MRQSLRSSARSLRNLVLMFGFLGGIAGLLALAAGAALWPVAPHLVQPYVDRYPAMPAWLCIGLAAGVVALLWYRSKFPENPRGAALLLTVLTGLGGLAGLGFALAGPAGGGAALLFSLLGIGSYIYMEKAPPTE